MAILKRKVRKRLIEISFIVSLITGGGFLAIFTFLNDFNDSAFSKKLHSNPNWDINIDYNEKNSLYDIVSIKSKNENINIISMEMLYYIKDTVVNVWDYRDVINTEIFKKSIIDDIISLNHTNSNWTPETEFMIYEIPVALKVDYEFLGEKMSDTRIYKYIAELYVSKDDYYIKSIDFDFIKAQNPLSDLKKELIISYLYCNDASETLNKSYVYLELAKLNPTYEKAARLYNVMRLFRYQSFGYDEAYDNRLGGEFDKKRGILNSSYDSLDKFGRKGYIYLHNIQFTTSYKSYLEYTDVINFIIENKSLYNYEINNTIPQFYKIIEEIYDEDESFTFYPNADTIRTLSLKEAAAFEENNYYLKNKWDSLNSQILEGVKKLIDHEKVEELALIQNQ